MGIAVNLAFDNINLDFAWHSHTMAGE
jgi:hypothetical protein